MPRHSLLAFGVCFLLPSPVTGQGTGQQPQLPDSVYGFSLTETSTLPGTAGIAYRYQNRAKVWADVFVYAVPSDRLGASDSVQLASETEEYVTGLAAGIDRGRYDAYEVPVNRPVSVDTKAETPVSGRVVVMVFHRGDQSFVSFMHLFLKGQSYVKVRLTLPAAEWQDSMAPNFALELAKHLSP